jgi:hypothetical protein
VQNLFLLVQILEQDTVRYPGGYSRTRCIVKVGVDRADLLQRAFSGEFNWEVFKGKISPDKVFPFLRY